MLINLPENFPAIELLKQQNIATTPFISIGKKKKDALRVAVLNLMPLKIETEADILRLLSYSPLPIKVDFIWIENHTPKNTPLQHIKDYYKPFSSIITERYDGFIVTGAPVELIPFEEVTYWNELQKILDWAHNNVRSTLYICWGAQAALYHFYQIPKYPLKRKLLGIYPHTVNDFSHLLFRGFNDEFYVPHSRHTTILEADIAKQPQLDVLSTSIEAGVYIVGNNKNDFFITGHSEYAPMALHNEYVRDIKKGLTTVDAPHNYYHNGKDLPPKVMWRSHANLLFSNWIHYFANQL